MPSITCFCWEISNHLPKKNTYYSPYYWSNWVLPVLEEWEVSIKAKANSQVFRKSPRKPSMRKCQHMCAPFVYTYTCTHTHSQELVEVSPFSSWVAVGGLETKTGFYISDSLLFSVTGCPLKHCLNLSLGHSRPASSRTMHVIFW